MGLTIDSKGIVATEVNKESPFFNIDPIDFNYSVDISHVMIYGELSPPCDELEDFYTFDPMLLALVDTATGAIAFIVELDRMEGELVPDSSCVLFLPG